MKISVYDSFPDYAKEIRKTVFIDEQGFRDEFDETDKKAAHFVMFDEDETPVATCRAFWNEEMNAYALGRFAVVRKYRGKNLGSALMNAVETYVKENGGKDIVLHAQCQAAGFYKKSGFTEFGNIEEEQGCPHIWMKKSV